MGMQPLKGNNFLISDGNLSRESIPEQQPLTLVIATGNLLMPYDWSIEGKIDHKNPTGGAGGFPAGIGWYRKTIQVPNTWEGKKVMVCFGGVNMNSEVFMNGKSLGFYPYGYTSFAYDVTPFLNLQQKNVISVRVDNSQQQNCRWYSGSGIYRHVWLMVTNPVHIAHWGTYITSAVGTNNTAAVKVRTVLKNETGSKQSIVLSTQITGKSNGNIGRSDDAIEFKISHIILIA